MLHVANTEERDVQQIELVERLLGEGLIGMGEAATRFGSVREGQPVHPVTVARWGRSGIKLADGTILRLETITLNGRAATTMPAILRFVAAQQGTTAPIKTPARRSKASAAAAAELDKLGVR